ncbi:MAG: hypothetical protein LBM96_06115, partial [Methanobrevibacter sp.]|nr:hypothetical protein [Candidatus Methanoflexus mossambicus]
NIFSGDNKILSFNGTTYIWTFVNSDNNTIYCHCGCFIDTFDELIKKINNNQDKKTNDRLKLIELVKNYYNI